MSTKVILFDVDGTLLVHNDLMPDCLYKTLAHYGVDVKLDAKELSGKTDLQNFKFYLQKAGYRSDELEKVAAALCRKLVVVVKDQISSYDMKPASGVIRLLEKLHMYGYTMGLLTGNVEDIVPVKLSAAGIHMGYFSFGAYGDERELREDLAGLALERAEAELGIALDGEEVLVVGDTPRDITCARSIGARVLAVPGGKYSHQELEDAQPDYLLSDLSDMKKFRNCL